MVLTFKVSLVVRTCANGLMVLKLNLVLNYHKISNKFVIFVFRLSFQAFMKYERISQGNEQTASKPVEEKSAPQETSQGK